LSASAAEQETIEMTRTARGALVALSMALSAIAPAQPAAAGSDDGEFGIKLLGTVVDPDTDATVRAGGVRILGAEADISTEVIPALTLDYYFTKNLSAELFCCFS
jgi:outer membrane protein